MTTTAKLTSTRPYLLNAFYQWILDNGLTPYILVDASLAKLKVPEHFIKDGKIVLNINPSAIQNFTMDKHALQFSARFSGTPYFIDVPLFSIEAIYAKENGKGMVFQPENPEDFKQEETEPPPKNDPPKRPSLKVVK